MTPVSLGAEPARPRRLVKRPLFWALMSLLGLVIVFGAMLVAAVPLSSDTLRHRIVGYLSDKLDSEVELGDLHLRAFPRLRVEGADLRIRKRGFTDYPPLISIKSFHVDASIVGLYRKHVDHVRLDGLDINIAPSQARDRVKTEVRSEKSEVKSEKLEVTSGNDPFTDAGIIIDRMDTVDARLIILPFEKDKTPKVWAIHDLHMRELGSTRPWPFEATLTNGVPPGEIAVNGMFGPWHRDEPGDTPLEGAFMFAKADLSVFKGIAGTLSSHGYFGGTLARLDANGDTYTPDFTIAVGGHPFPLYVKYQALIDGTNGDTRLENIDAWFLNSFLHAKGAVLDAPKGQHGRTVALDVAMDKSRIEDVMKMAVKAASPPMVGSLKLNTKFLLPPGENDVVDRLRLDGQFWIGKARFTNYDVQGKIEELSKRARGKTAEPAKERVASDFQGRFKLGGGRLALPDVSFDVPGARVELAGGYALKAETMDFKGQLLLDAKISETTTGWRSLLLKVVDPLFKQKGGSGSAIPIKIGGSRNAPDFGLDVRRVFRRGE
jgi:AsmA-like C-terminal region